MKRITRDLRKLVVSLAMLLMLLALGLFAGCSSEHTMKFEAGEGVDIPDIVAAAGASVTPPADPQKEGFEFEGWYLTEDLSGEKQTIPSVMPEEDVTYYGKWAPLPKITLSLGGGSLAAGETLYLKAGANLYEFMQNYLPEREGHKFYKWFQNGEYLAESAVMPAEGVELSAVWEVSYKVAYYKLDFSVFDEWTEDGNTTAYALAGTEVNGADFVPEHWSLSEEKTVPVTVEESGETVLSVYLEPLYTRYLDVFESDDYLYEFEPDPGVLWLDRVGMADGRKQSTSYDAETGLFTFKTGEEADAFVLSGKITGDRFYYFRDTIERTFEDELGSGATLEIKSPQEVIYTPEQGAAVKGSYSVDPETGRYVLTPESGEPFEFVLISYRGELFFRTHDGVEGWYAYGGTFAEGGWAIFGFDGFGVATYLDDEEKVADYDYVVRDDGIVSVSELGLIKLTDAAHGDLGGHAVKGTFSTSDGREGRYYKVNGRRTDVLELNGFGGAKRSWFSDDTEEEAIGEGTYEMESDESWLINGYSQTTGAYTVGYYSGVNSWLVYTDSEGTEQKFLLSEETDEMGLSVLAYAEYDEDSFDGLTEIKPGKHQVTNSFEYKGTTYPVDEDHPAFLYFSTSEVVELWYGEETRYGVVYDRIVYGEWYSYGGNEIYNFDLDYDGMYFTDMAEDGSFAFDHETWYGEVEQYVFFDNEKGSLIIDALGVARYTDAEGKVTEVEYEQKATGLLIILNFKGLPAGVGTTYAVYSDEYELDGDGSYKVYAVGPDTMLEIEGGGITLFLTDDGAYLGVLMGYEYEDVTDPSAMQTFIEFLFFGTVKPVEGSDDEFTFTWDDSIYYDELDYFSDDDLEVIMSFAEFRYKVVGETFLYYDGIVYDLTDTGNDQLVTDGYGHATLTLTSPVSLTMEGSYSQLYTVIIFTPEESGTGRNYYLRIEENSFTLIDVNSPAAELLGVYYVTALADDGMPSGIGLATLFLDGVDGFVYETVQFTGDYDYEIVSEEGTFEIVSGPVESQDGKLETYTLKLTFAENDVRDAFVMFYDYYGDGNMYGFFLISNPALLGTYQAFTDDGEALGTLTGGDGYDEESATFRGEDANGPFDYEGYMARGFISDEYYDQSLEFEADPDGDVVVFVTYIDGEMVQYVFDFKGDDLSKVYYRDKFYGTVAEYETVGGTTGNYLRLDGHGAAALYNEEDELQCEGTYDFVPGKQDAYSFKSDDGKTQFIFKPSAMSYGGGVLYYYTVYGEKDEYLFIADDWSILSMDGFGNAAYIDKYGAVTQGEYYAVVEEENIYGIKVYNSTERLFFELKEDGGFAFCEGEFLVRGGVLYLYFGSAESITIPEGVTEIAQGAFGLEGSLNIKHVDFNKVTKIQDKAFYYCNLESVESETILEVGTSAFENIKALVSVDLPNCTSIGERAFYGCTNLASVKLGKIETIGKYAFTHSIALEAVAMTFDLTEVDWSNVNIDLTAFQAERGYFGLVKEHVLVEGSKILVSGTEETLNTLAGIFKKTVSTTCYTEGKDSSGQAPCDYEIDLTPYLELSFDDTAERLAFYSLSADAAFLFTGGKFVKYTKSSYSNDYEESETYSYYIKDSKAVLYHFDEAQKKYVKGEEIDLTATIVTVGGITAIKSREQAQTETEVGGKKVVITYTAAIENFFGLSVTISVVSVTYDGAPAEGVDWSQYSNLLEFTAGGHGFEGSLENGAFTVKDLGKIYVLPENKSQKVWFRVTIGVADDGTITLNKLEYNSYGDEYPDSYYEASYGIEAGSAPNTWTYEFYDYSTYSDVTYLLTVTGSNGNYTLTVTTVSAD